LYIACLRSEKENVVDKKTVFSHYTSGSLKHITL